MREGKATPAAPRPRTNTPTQLPRMLTTLAAVEMYMVAPARPVLRHRAAPASYTARAGRDQAVITR